MLHIHISKGKKKLYKSALVIISFEIICSIYGHGSQIIHTQSVFDTEPSESITKS